MNVLPVIIIISGIFIPGIINMVKAKTGGRKMPSVFQPWYDVARLFKKNTVYSHVTGFVFKLAPIVYFASICTALLLIPLGEFSGVFSFKGNFVVFSYLLALGKFMMIIAALDTGSGFEGMGANREALYSWLTEPAFFILMGSTALFTDITSFDQLFAVLHQKSSLAFSVNLAAIFILFYIVMIENSRMPVDDPKTHLELTMVHEVMILDNSGFDLALYHMASWLKFAIYGTFISNLFINTVLPGYMQMIWFLTIQFSFAVIIGIIESFSARNKLAKNTQWIINLTAIAVIVFLISMIITQKIILN
jgi:formate hydrogenlyase subunit 4